MTLTVKDRTNHRPVRSLLRELAGAIWHLTRSDRRITWAALAGAGVAIVNQFGPPIVVLPAMALLAWWKGPRLIRALDAAVFTTVEEHVAEWVTTVMLDAGITPVPVVRLRDHGWRHGGVLPDVSVHPHSWRVELDTVTAAKGITSAHDLCQQFGRIKTHAGDGCVFVSLRERSGGHVTMIVVWDTAPGQRIAHIGGGVHIIVSNRQSRMTPAWNSGLAGWTSTAHEYAREAPIDDDAARHGWTLDDTSLAVIEADESPADDDHDPEDEPDDDDLVADDDSGSHDKPEPTVTCAPISPGHDAHGPAHLGGGGGERTTPPPAAEIAEDPFAAPPSGNPSAPPQGFPDRPLDAPEGSKSGAVWNLLVPGGVWTRGELARTAECSPGSVSNLLRGWAQLGLVEPGDDGWRLRLGRSVTVPMHGSDKAAP